MLLLSPPPPELAAVNPGAAEAMGRMDKDSDRRISIIEWCDYFEEASEGGVDKAADMLQLYRDALVANNSMSQRG